MKGCCSITCTLTATVATHTAEDQLAHVFLKMRRQLHVGVTASRICKYAKFPRAHLCVDDISNGVDKLHDVLLQHLSGVCEVPDVTEPKDSNNLVARNHGVQIAPTPYIVGYDLCPSIPKAHGQKAADLVNGVLQDPGFHLRVVAVVLGGLRFRQGVL